MAAALKELNVGDQALAELQQTETVIAKLKERGTGLSFEDKSQYEEGRIVIGEFRTLRGQIEKRRKELKEDALNWGRKVDALAKKLTSAIEAIEEPLKAAKAIVDQRAEEARMAKINEAKRIFEEKIRAEREAEEAKLRAEREAEEARLKEENERLAKERAEMEAERRKLEAAAAAERAKLEAERRALQAEKERQDRIEFERQAKVRAEEDALRKLERERELAKAKAEAEEREAKRLEELRPDKEKIASFAAILRGLQCPAVDSDEARGCLDRAVKDICYVADYLESWKA